MMRKPVNIKAFVILLEGVVLSISATVVMLLLIRWTGSEIFDFKHFVSMVLLYSSIASLLGFFVMQTYRIRFRTASFVAVANILGATLIKELLLMLFFWIFHLEIAHLYNPMMFHAFDFCITIVILILYQVSLIAIDDYRYRNSEDFYRKLTVFIYKPDSSSSLNIIDVPVTNKYHIKGFLTRNKKEDGFVCQGYDVYYYDGKSLDLFRKCGVEALLFTDEAYRIREHDDLVRECLSSGICILTVPGIQSINYDGVDVERIKNIVNSYYLESSCENGYITTDNMSKGGKFLKYVFDFFVSAVLLVAFFPLYLMLYLAIKLDDGGPAIYKQERIGLYGKPFYIYKFRTMRVDAEADGPALAAGEIDPRLTKVGKFLRAHHLDELPQLFNVLRGDMSFVGYRPERKFYIDLIMQHDSRYSYLYEMRPGVTSYATLKNGYTDTMEKMLRRLEFDLYYLNHRTLGFDVRILWYTFINIFRGEKF